MVKHEFVCDKCNIVVKDHTMRGIHRCPECGEDMRWDGKIAIHGNYKHPIHSDSLAIHSSQRAKHKRLFPNIELDKQNRPVFHKFVDHEAYLKKTGFVKMPQKIRAKGVRIS